MVHDGVKTVSMASNLVRELGKVYSIKVHENFAEKIKE